MKLRVLSSRFWQRLPERISEMKITKRTGRFVLFAVMLLIPFLVTVPAGKTSTFLESYNHLKVFSEVLREVLENYVIEIDAGTVMKGAVRGMLEQLDPHTVYLPEESFEELQVSTRGNFGGLGIQISMRDEWLTVISPIEGTPADRIGIRSGDKIIRIEGESTRGITVEDAVNKLRGPKGTDVTISIFRESFDEPVDFTITRDIIEIKSIPYSGILSSGTGYIRLIDFSEGSGENVAQVIADLNQQGIDGLILDLRNNTGGLLPEAINVSESFLPKGKLVVSTKGRHLRDDKEFFSRADPVVGDYPLIVLVNGGTASASEIVSGAIQDWDRGLILGRETYGKGSVQTIRRLSEKTALKLTTAYYYTPAGRCIHRDEKRGSILDPDSETVEPDSSDSAREEIFYTESGRIVFGNGGINPDLEFEGRLMGRLMIEILRKGLFFKFGVAFAAEKDSLDLPLDSVISSGDIRSFRDFLVDEDVQFTNEDFSADSLLITERLLSEVIGDIHGKTAAYKLEIEFDPLIAMADSLIVSSADLETLMKIVDSESGPGTANPDDVILTAGAGEQ